jgi:hypothetical protein
MHFRCCRKGKAKSPSLLRSSSGMQRDTCLRVFGDVGITELRDRSVGAPGVFGKKAAPFEEFQQAAHSFQTALPGRAGHKASRLVMHAHRHIAKPLCIPTWNFRARRRTQVKVGGAARNGLGLDLGLAEWYSTIRKAKGRLDRESLLGASLIDKRWGGSTPMITTGSSAYVKTFDQFDVALRSISLRAETRAAQLAL